MKERKDCINTTLLMKMTSNAFERLINQHLLDDELTFSQGNILGYLRLNCDKEVNPLDIEREFELKKSTVSGLLKRLEQKGFLILEESKRDKRYKQIKLTDKAYEHAKKVDFMAKELEQEIFKGISREELQNFRSLLWKMLDNII